MGSSMTMTVELPAMAVEQLRGMAQQQRRSVRDIVQDLILRALPGLPQEVKDELATFAQLSDDVLWLLARTTLPEKEQQELADLNDKAQRRSLTEPEAQRQQALVEQYHRVMVRRAEAARILKSRGHDLSAPDVLRA